MREAHFAGMLPRGNHMFLRQSLEGYCEEEQRRRRREGPLNYVTNLSDTTLDICKAQLLNS